MALEQRLSLKLGQRLVMTPSLQQAIKLLQMSKLELVEEVQQELLENPVLEERLNDSPAKEEAPPESSEEKEKDPFDEIDVDSYFQEMEYTPTSPSTREFRDDLPTFESTLVETTDLSDHLTWQLDMNTSDPLVKEIGRAIIGNLDDAGYLKATIEEIQQIGGFTEEAVRTVLATIQQLDPVGVGATNLQECLLIQLTYLDYEGTIAETLIRDHIDRLQDPRQYKKLADMLDLGMDDLQAEIEFIRSLDPRPGLKYNAERSNYVTPDVYVVRVDHDYKIVLNEEGLPRLHISPVYRRMLSKKNLSPTSEDAKEYVQKKFRAALRLIKSLEERQRTIYKVADSIVKFQRDFLDSGIERLRPLVLKDVAEDIGMHESTVSRVVNNKYMHTHRGLFEMRFFFHSGIARSRGGEDMSSLTVKEHIRKLIKDEDPRKPLSDASIEKILKLEGLQIARRTVAKYREEMHISASSNRKQVFG